MTLFLAYGAPDPETGLNPNWKTFGYPGPAGVPPQVPKPLEVKTPADGETIEADVCVVGSGSGGGVIAGTLAKQGLKVVVLEASGYFNESDFAQLELQAYQDMFWRGGPQPTADGNISMQAGTTLGGGTTINWTNCLRTTDWVRSDWANEFGLEGLDGSDYDRHLDAVLDRIGATDKCSDLNGPQQRMKDAADELGWSFKTIIRNAEPGEVLAGQRRATWASATSPARRTPATAPGCATRSRTAPSSTCAPARSACSRRTAARPASRRCTSTPRATSRAASPCARRPVVVACGSLESPALLLRCGIGGPAVGNYLRLHPCVAIIGSYADDQRAWWGAPQAGLVDEFANVENGYGFLIESVQYAPGLIGSAMPWVSAEAHKELVSRAKYNATFVPLPRDHGHGRVEVDASGEAVVWYSVEDEQDRRTIHLGHRQARRGAPRRRARSRSPRSRPACRAGGAATTSDASPSASSGSRSAAAAGACSPRTRWARAGWAATRRRASRTRGASCTTRRASGSATPARSRPRRAPTRWSRSWRSRTAPRRRSPGGRRRAHGSRDAAGAPAHA